MEKGKIIEFIKKEINEDMVGSYTFGIRVDDIQYKIGDTANASHELYQDPLFDEDGELIYAEGEGAYEGYYDAGELDGTCCIKLDPEKEESIKEALELVEAYCGEYIHILCGDVARGGNDCGEVIIRDAKVIFACERG